MQRAIPADEAARMPGEWMREHITRFHQLDHLSEDGVWIDRLTSLRGQRP